MFVTKATYFKCPYCNHEYEKVVGNAVCYKYKNGLYSDEVCVSCGKEFLYDDNDFEEMPTNKEELEFHSFWMS